MDDATVIALYESRDERALSLTQQEYGGCCYTVAYNILGSAQDAEECVNDTLMKLWNAIPPAKPDSLYAYAAATARNLAKNRYKQKHVQKRGGSEADIALDELSVLPIAPDNVEAESDARAMQEALNRFLETLSADHRKIFVQRYWYFMPVDDISNELGITKSKVTVTLMRTRTKLKNYLEKEGFL